MRHFRWPLIITGIVFAVGLVIGIGGMAMILGSNASSREKNARATMLGQGLGIAIPLVVAPFWLFAAAKVGKERREALAQSQKKPKRRK